MFWKISNDITASAEGSYDPEEDEELDVVWNVYGVVVVDDDSTESEEAETGPALEAPTTNSLIDVDAMLEAAGVAAGETARADAGQSGGNDDAQS